MSLFRSHKDNLAHVEDIVSAGQADWHGRVNRAIAGETSANRRLYVALGIIALMGGGQIYQMTHGVPPTIIHVVHNSLGGVIAVDAARVTSEGPTQVELKAAVEQWIINSRSVYVDINAMRRSLYASAYLIDKGSQADIAFARWYNNPVKEAPFVRATRETVALDNVTAVPPTASDIGADGLQTWQVTWNERVTSRDGSSEIVTPWAANVTLFLRQPKDVVEGGHDPNGVHIVSYSWTEKT
jgi:type IV secretory pathway TrbF-like protein